MCYQVNQVQLGVARKNISIAPRAIQHVSSLTAPTLSSNAASNVIHSPQRIIQSARSLPLQVTASSVNQTSQGAFVTQPAAIMLPPTKTIVIPQQPTRQVNLNYNSILTTTDTTRHENSDAVFKSTLMHMSQPAIRSKRQSVLVSNQFNSTAPKRIKTKVSGWR
jgi:hypothetical protein